MNRPSRSETKQRTRYWPERVAVAHAFLLVAAAAWMFGGKIWWAKPLLCILVTPAIFLSVVEYQLRRKAGTQPSTQTFLWLIPIGILAALILASGFNSNLVERHFGKDLVFAPRSMSAGLPSSPDAGRTWRELWLLGGCYLVGFNVFVCTRSRRTVRRLMLALALNALALAVFGTFQKLLGYDIMFGLQHAPHAAFFSTFIYHNHWGAFMLLMTSLSLGWVFHHSEASGARDFWHSPAFLGVIATLLMVVTLPLSTSRSCTLLGGLLLLGAGAHAAWRICVGSSSATGGRTRGMIVLLVATLVCSFGIYQLSAETIHARVATTRTQWAEMRSTGNLGQRRVLYSDTWRMAEAKPWFGWGLESYERVFPLFNSTPLSPVDRLPIYYQEAHSDWLQLVAELGFVGAALVLAAIALPLFSLGKKAFRHAMSAYPLIGCGLVALYSTVEFPFANPAVFAAWWIGFFGALRLAALSEGT